MWCPLVSKEIKAKLLLYTVSLGVIFGRVFKVYLFFSQGENINRPPAVNFVHDSTPIQLTSSFVEATRHKVSSFYSSCLLKWQIRIRKTPKLFLFLFGDIFYLVG